MRFAANIAFLFTEEPWPRRFEAAAEAGFGAVEFPWPPLEPAAVTAAARTAGVDVVLLNAEAGDLAAGHRGYANDPARVDEFRRAVDRALELAVDLDCPCVNVLPGRHLDGVSSQAQWRTVESNLAWALERAAGTGVQLLLEVLNHLDVPDYLFTRVPAAAGFVRAFEGAGLRLQFDAYHVAIVEPDLLAAYRAVADLVGHVQLADVPGRHEPGTGSAPLAALLRALVADGYRGAVGLEYVPTGATSSTLAWLPPDQRGGAVTGPGWSGLPH